MDYENSIEVTTDYLARMLKSRGLVLPADATGVADRIRQLAASLRADIEGRYDAMEQDADYKTWLAGVEREIDETSLGEQMSHNFFSSIPEPLATKYGFSLFMWDSGVSHGLQIYVNPATADVSEHKNFDGPAIVYPITSLTGGRTAKGFDGLAFPKHHAR